MAPGGCSFLPDAPFKILRLGNRSAKLATFLDYSPPCQVLIIIYPEKFFFSLNLYLYTILFLRKEKNSVSIDLFLLRWIFLLFLCKAKWNLLVFLSYFYHPLSFIRYYFVNWFIYSWILSFQLIFIIVSNGNKNVNSLLCLLGIYIR